MVGKSKNEEKGKKEEKLVRQLHSLERKVLPLIAEGEMFAEIVRKTGLQEVEVMRALQWLANKKLIEVEVNEKKMIVLGENGKIYQKEGLPEERFLNQLVKGKEMSLTEIKKKAELSDEEAKISIGQLKLKGFIEIIKGKELSFKITALGEKQAKQKSLERAFLEEKFPLDLGEITPEQKYALDAFKKRKDIVRQEKKKTRKVKLTALGREVKTGLGKVKGKVLDRLTPEMLKKGTWKKKKFRAYDIKINVPKVYATKFQHYRSFLEEVRQKFLAMGFTEMFGPLVESDFWDMDALYMPQFHSARDIHQAYYVKEPDYGKLNKKLVKNVKAAHENGFKTGSKGWRYEFDEKRTHRLLLRTQGTALSARQLAAKDLKIPGKYFAIAKCFRYDVVDATHLPDFYQTEGIVLNEGLNFSHLKGLLKMFAEEFCQTDQVKIVPGYFPFTEPSAELFAKHPELGWIELGGSGIFRPELTKPLGVDVPVIAWGIGIDRVGMFNMGIKDIRDLYSHDLNFLRYREKEEKRKEEK